MNFFCSVRGALNAISNPLYNSGLIISFFLGNHLSCADQAKVQLIVPVVFLISMFFFPESPEFWTNKNKDKVSLRNIVDALPETSAQCSHFPVLNFRKRQNHADSMLVALQRLKSSISFQNQKKNKWKRETPKISLKRRKLIRNWLWKTSVSFPFNYFFPTLSFFTDFCLFLQSPFMRGELFSFRLYRLRSVFSPVVRWSSDLSRMCSRKPDHLCRQRIHPF